MSARKQHALELFEGLPARYDRMGAAMSFGQDPRWRRAMVRAVGPVAGRRLLDVASGTGLVAADLVRAGASEVVGLDQSPEMLAGARARLARQPELARRVTSRLSMASRSRTCSATSTIRGRRWPSWPGC